MTIPTEQQQETPARRKPWLALAIGLAVVLVLAIAGAAVVLLVVKPFDRSVLVTGELVLEGSGIKYGYTSADCVGTGGYDDIHEGTQVVISDAEGKTIAVGGLLEGRATGVGIRPTRCTFAFSVKAPAGEDFYGVSVGRRGTTTYSAERLGEPLRLTLS